MLIIDALLIVIRLTAGETQATAYEKERQKQPLGVEVGVREEAAMRSMHRLVAASAGARAVHCQSVARWW
jgi:hypothetical protein